MNLTPRQAGVVNFGRGDTPLPQHLPTPKLPKSEPGLGTRLPLLGPHLYCSVHYAPCNVSSPF